MTTSRYLPLGALAVGAVSGALNGAVGISGPPAIVFYFATTAALVTNPLLFKTLPYDPAKDFVPVAFIARSPRHITPAAAATLAARAIERAAVAALRCLELAHPEMGRGRAGERDPLAVGEVDGLLGGQAESGVKGCRDGGRGEHPLGQRLFQPDRGIHSERANACAPQGRQVTADSQQVPQVAGERANVRARAAIHANVNVDPL